MVCRAGAINDRTRFKCPEDFVLGKSLSESDVVTQSINKDTTVIEVIP